MTDTNVVRLSGTLNDEVSENKVGNAVVAETDLHFELPGKDGSTRKAWIQLQAWNERAAQLLEAGSSGVGTNVVVEGSLNRRAWKNRDDEWESKYSIRVEKVTEEGVAPDPDNLFE